MEALIEIRHVTSNKQRVEEAHVEEFVELIEGGWKPPPITVRAVATGYRLVDGRHRLEALRRTGHTVVRGRLTL